MQESELGVGAKGAKGGGALGPVRIRVGGEAIRAGEAGSVT